MGREGIVLVERRSGFGMIEAVPVLVLVYTSPGM